MRHIIAQPPATPQENLRGIVLMLAAMAMFILNDSMMKLAGADLPLGELIFVRGLFASAMILVWAWLAGALRRFRLLLQPAAFLRATGEIGATLLYLSALMAMQIGPATAILQVVPLAATAASAVFLGEKVGWRRWMAAAAGFVGVLLVIRPGAEDFKTASLLALAAVAFIVLRDLATRGISRETPSLLLTVVTAGGVSLAGGAMGLGEDWVAIGARELALLAGAGAFLMGAHFALINAMRSGDISAIAPFRYSNVLWALLIGFLVWGDVPDPATGAGILVVAVAGIYTFSREARLKREVRARLREEAA